MGEVQEIRLDHYLNENSNVFEIGGYTGNFSGEIIGKFNCNVFIFEPIKELFDGLVSKYSNNPKVRVFNYGLENFTGVKNISLLGDGSSLYSHSDDVTEIQLRNVNEVLDELKLNKIDLIEINCEGSEYNILKELTKSNHINNIERIQIQFHFLDLVNYSNERKECQDLLSKTHNQIWDMVIGTFECWELKA
jgi:FkbM family methyltransferase